MSHICIAAAFEIHCSVSSHYLPKLVYMILSPDKYSKISRLTSFLEQAKPYTAVTVQIERMTKEEYEEEDLSGIVDLIEVIKLQSSGPIEAARAIRKKL